MKTTTTILSLALGLSLAACAADTDPGNGGGAPASGAASTDPTTSAPEYAISCQGGVTKRSFDTSVALRCGSEPGMKCGDPCGAQQVSFRYVPPAMRCGSVDRFAWDGTACKAYPTNQGGEMRCTGADCERLFTTKELCLAAYDACITK